MRIAQLNTEEIGGGAAKIARKLFKRVRERGHDSRFLVRRRETSDPGVQALYHDYGNGWQRLWGTVDKWLESGFGSRRGVYQARQLIHYLANPAAIRDVSSGLFDFNYPGARFLLDQLQEKPDVIHLHNLHGNYFDLRALPKISREVPVIWTLHDEWALTGICAYTLGCQRWKDGCGDCPQIGTNYSPPDATDTNLELKRRIYEQSNLIVCSPSRWLHERAQESVLGEQEAFYHIPNGVNLDIFCPREQGEARSELGVSENRKVVLYVANKAADSPWKDYQTVTKAAEEIGNRWEGDLTLLCLGGAGQASQEGRVRIVPISYESDERKVATYYQAADLYLHAAKAENHPLAVIEAMACGTPIIASDVGGVGEIVKDGEVGHLVPAESPTQMAKAAVNLLENEEKHEDFEDACLYYARESFSLEGMIDKYMELYREASSV